MSVPLNDFQESIELLWSERHQQPKHVADISKEMLNEASIRADSLAIGLASRNLGYIDFIGGNLEKAWDWLSSALEIGKRHNVPTLVAEASNFLAGVYRSMGNTTSAFGFLENALKIYEDLGLIEQCIPLKMNMGVLLQDIGRHEEAVSYFEGAEQILADYPNEIRKLEVASNLAMSLLELDKAHAARDLLLDILKSAQEQQLAQHQTRILVNLGEVYTKLKKFPEALIVLQQALKLMESGVTPEGEAYCLLNLASVQKHLEDWKGAQVLLQKAWKAAEKLNTIPVQIKIAYAQYEIHKIRLRPQAALKAFEIYHRIFEQQRQHNAEQELRLFMLERDFEKTVAEAEISRLKNVELAQLLERVQESDRAKAQLLEELGIKTQQLEVMVKQDSLTGVYNRRFLEQSLELEIQKAKQGRYPLSLALLDIDNFKQINDQYSHHIGDQVLIIIGELMRNCIRAKDIAARYGGEEFALALPRASVQQAKIICERLRKSIQDYPWDQLHPNLRVTASIGISADMSVTNHEKLLHLADTQMYNAKRSGKNKVCAETSNPRLVGVILEDNN